MKITKTAEQKETLTLTKSSTNEIFRVLHDEYTIDMIDTKEKLELTGNVRVLGDIKNGANITITCGDLSVGGNVEDNVSVEMKKDADKLPGFSNIHAFSVQGNVGHHVAVTTKHASIIIKGSIGHHDTLTTAKGNISILGNVGHHSKLEAKTSVYSYCTVFLAKEVEHDAAIKTKNGDICILAKCDDPTVKLETEGGEIRVNREVRANRRIQF